MRKAIRSGRLRKSIGRDARGPFVANVALAKREWVAGASKLANAGGRKPRGPGTAAPRVGSLVEAQVRVAAGRALALDLANRRRSGETHDVAACEREQFEIARVLRERILNVPDRLADLGPVVRARIRAELRQALGEIADGLEHG